MLAASASAHFHTEPHQHDEPVEKEQNDLASYTSQAFNEYLVGGFHAWNCMTCKLAFSAIDKFLLTDKFDSGLHSVATKICEFKDFVPDDMDVCPLMTEHYEMALLSAVSKYMLSG